MPVRPWSRPPQPAVCSRAVMLKPALLFRRSDTNCMETWCDWERREGGEVSPQPDHRTGLYRRYRLDQDMARQLAKIVLRPIAENCSPPYWRERSPPYCREQFSAKGGEQFSALLKRTFSALLQRIPE